METKIEKANKKIKLGGNNAESSVKVAEQMTFVKKKKTMVLELMKSAIKRRNDDHQKRRKAIHNERKRNHVQEEEKRLGEDEKPLTSSEKQVVCPRKRNERSRSRRAEIEVKNMEEAVTTEAAQARRRELKRLRTIKYEERMKAEKAEKLAKRKNNSLKKKEQRKTREDSRGTESGSAGGYEIDLSDEDLPLATIFRHIKNPLQVPETPRRREILEVDHIPDFRLRCPMDDEYPDRDEIFPITSDDLANVCRVSSQTVGYDSDSDAPLSTQMKKKAPVQLQLHNNRMGRGKPRVAGATPEIRMEKIEKELEKLNKRWIMLSEEARSLFPELPESAVTRKVQDLIRRGAQKT